MYNPLEFLALEKSKRIEKYKSRVESIAEQLTNKIDTGEYEKIGNEGAVFYNTGLELYIKDVLINPEDLSNAGFMLTLNEFFSNLSWTIAIEEKKDGQLDLFEGYNIRLKQISSYSYGSLVNSMVVASSLVTEAPDKMPYTINNLGK